MIRGQLNESNLYVLDPAIRQKKSFNSDDAFIMKKRGLILNPNYRKLMRGRNIVYEYLWAKIVRKFDADDPYNIKEDYYERGFLACCMSYRALADECFMGINTIRRYIKSFKKAGIIFIHTYDKSHSVFELGRWKEVDGKPINYYYIDDIFYK